VHRFNDLGVVDALQIHGRDAKVAVAELTLDDHERYAFMCEFDGMRVTQLVRGEVARTPADAAVSRNWARAAATDQRRPRVGPVITQNSGPTGSSSRTISHGRSCSQAQSSMWSSLRTAVFADDDASPRSPRSAIARR
jgi:hypothetical protein